jgi:hypothetical protein
LVQIGYFPKVTLFRTEPLPEYKESGCDDLKYQGGEQGAKVLGGNFPTSPSSVTIVVAINAPTIDQPIPSNIQINFGAPLRSAIHFNSCGGSATEQMTPRSPTRLNGRMP